MAAVGVAGKHQICLALGQVDERPRIVQQHDAQRAGLTRVRFTHARQVLFSLSPHEIHADELHGAGYLFVGAIVLFLLIVWVVKKVLLKFEARHMADDSAHPRRGHATTHEGPAAEATDPSERGASG